MDALGSFQSDIEQSSSSPFWPRPSQIGEALGTDDEDQDDEENKKISWVKSWWFKRIVQACAVINLISMAMNTPETTITNNEYNSIFYITLCLDFAVAIVFTIEMVVLILYLGFRKTRNSYLFRPQCLFNTVMLFLIWLSIMFQLAEISGVRPSSYFVFSIFRAPRALIMLRVFKLFVNFRIPKAVSRRCGRQIWSVTIFFTYFMIFAALIGVQMFGEGNRYCVKNSTNVKNVTYSDVMIPESRCSPSNTGYACPRGFTCKQIDRKDFLDDKDYFTNIAYSILTVYESSTQEGWVLVMYQVMDFQNNILVVVYFVLLIFFVAWLVKNVFIAVVSELFADIRSSYSMKRWKARRRYTGLSSLVIRDEGAGWHLVSVDHEASKGHAPRSVRRIIHSPYFKYALWFCVLIDAVIQAANMYHWRREAQFFFTVLFDIEVLLKIWCVGFRAYIKPRMQLIEFVLAVGSTLLSPLVLIQQNQYAIFHVMRIVRLVAAIPTLQEFCQKVFGTGKKLGSVILFTLFFVIVCSVVSMQLFLTLKVGNDEYPFGTFPKALASMFQIITQEGWVEILETLMKSAGSKAATFVAIFLLAYHLFSSLIIMSVFVAVIVDNLEIDEELKILKQKKMGDVSFESQEKLPLRLRVYERFRENPRLVRMSRLKMQSDFLTPKIRESFMRRFVESRADKDVPRPDVQMRKKDSTPTLFQRRPGVTMKLLNYSQPEANRFTKILRKQSTISALIGSSNHHRSLALMSPSEMSPRGLASNVKGGSVFRSTSRRYRAKAAQSPAKSPTTAGDSFRSVGNISQSGSISAPSGQPFAGTSGREWDIQLLRERREQVLRKKQAQEETLRENHPFFDQPLLSVSRDSWFRTLMQSIVHARYTIPTWAREKASRNRILTTEKLHKLLASQTYLEWIMIFITVASCLSMMVERPDHRPFENPETSVFEHIFVVAMSLELGIRVLANGLIFTPNAVVQSFSGVLDIFVYFTSLALICWQPTTVEAGSAAQALLVVRCLRPLRIITLVPKMRQVIVELVGGYKEILKVSALQLILMFIFASYGVQVFSGKLGRCNDITITHPEKCVGTFKMPLMVPRELKNLQGKKPEMLVPRVWNKAPRNFNFDDVLNAFLALFEVLSLEGWLEVRDVIENQEALGRGYSFYVHLYVLLGSMIGLTLFVAVVVTNFNENKGIALLTVDQRRWQDLKKRLKLAQPLHMPPRPEDEGIRAKLFDATQSVLYKRVIVVLVLIECITLAVAKWTSAEKSLRKGLTSTAAVCTLLFVVDAALKIVAFTFRGYWHSRRNRFDLFLTASGVIWAILNFALEGDDGAYNASLVLGVVILVFRFLTLSGKHATLKMLMLTVLMSLVKSFFIIAALVLLLMCYALSGVVLFGTVKHGEAINRHANFYTSFNAMILLFRITTGEDWNKILHDCMIAYPYCTEMPNYWQSDCGNKAAALVYFISFYVIVCFVFLNLFIAVIIENFSLFYASDEDSLISSTDLRDFQRTWNVVDKQRRGVLSVRQAKLVLRLLENRLEIDSNSMIFKQMCVEIEKLRNGRDVTFHDVLEVLAYRLVDITRSLQLEELLEREDLEVSIAEEVAIQIIRDWFTKVRKKRAEREILKAESSSQGASSIESINTAVNEERDNENEQLEERDELRNSYREPDRDFNRDFECVRDRDHEYRRKRYRREREAENSSSDEDERVRSKSDASTLVSKRLSSPAIKLDLPSPPTRRKSSSSKSKVSTVSFMAELPHASETSPSLRQSRSARRRSTPSTTDAAKEMAFEVKDWWSQLNE